jgi:phosphinothricin acetyltransferase
MTLKKTDARIRIAIAADVPVIRDIYNQAVALRYATADLSPISLAAQHAWFLHHPPDKYPVYVVEENGVVVGWCSLSAYRPGRMALRFTAEVSYYIREDRRRQGLATRLLSHAMAECGRLGIKNVFAILLDINTASIALLEKLGFEKWGHLPTIADFDGVECGHLYYGCRITHDIAKESY